jgi:hypothetical protein
VFVDNIEDEDDSEDHANENRGNIFPTDGRVPWVVELIAEGRDDTEEEEIGVGEVHWIGEDRELKTRHLRIDEREIRRLGIVVL